MSFLKNVFKIQLFTLLLSSINFTWADVQFEAQVDRAEISTDESVTLKLIVQADGSVPVQTPSFTANDFDTLNEFQSSQVQTSIVNGSISTRFVRSFNYVLRPKKTGVLKITDIQTQIEGQSYTAGPVEITVDAGGGGTPPPRNYGGGGNGLRGSQKRQRGHSFFIRAETDKAKVYKGEQMIVSYYLYSRAQGFNAEAEKYPALPGFLKEELEIPLVQQNGLTRGELVTLDGEVWKRVLLAKYAAYPLKSGKLSIDTMGLKIQYYDSRSQLMDDDQEDLFTQFFAQMAPRVVQVRSEPVVIDVQSLPEQGKPDDFNDIIGQFEVSSSVDKIELRAHESVTYLLKIEGRGNLSSLETPKLKIPEGVEVFESRAQTRGGKGSSNQKVFEYLLIPRKEGQYTLPAFELTYFDPRHAKYLTKKSEPINLNVSAGDPSKENERPSLARVGEVKTNQPSVDSQNPSDGFSFSGFGEKTGLLKTLSAIVLILGALLIAWTAARPWFLKWLANRRERLRFRQSNKNWSDYEPKLQDYEAKSTFKEVLECYAFIEEKLCSALEKCYNVSPRALSRRELYESLVEKQKMTEDLWSKISSLLEFTEMVRFASLAGAISESQVRAELAQRFRDAQAIESEIAKSL